MTSHGLKRTLAVVGSFAAATLLLGACAGSPAPAPTESADAGSSSQIDLSDVGASEAAQAEMLALYEAALANGENEIMFYSAASQAKLRPTLTDVFSERFPGIKALSTELSGATQTAALEAERATGKHIGDIMENPNSYRYTAGGYAEPYPILDLELPEGTSAKLREGIMPSDGVYTAQNVSLFGIAVNTDKIDANDVPTSWSDLADPKWAGKLVMVDPVGPGPGQAVLNMLMLTGAVDEPTMEAIAANMSVKADLAQATQSVISGEYPLLLGAALPTTRLAKDGGAPVEFHLMAKDNVAITQKTVLLANAPHPNAAKLYLNWLFTEEAQKLQLKIGATPVIDVPNDTDVPTLAEAKLADLPSEKEQIDATPRLVEYYETIFGKGNAG